MPGSSIWLTPPPTSPLNAALTKLIYHTLPPQFNPAPPAFAPHITLTSDIPPSVYSANGPQAWLDSLPFHLADDRGTKAKEVEVIFDHVQTEEVFFRRCYIKISTDRQNGDGGEGLKAVAKTARQQGVFNGDEARAKAWVDEKYMPHLSLVYSNTVLNKKRVEEVQLEVLRAGVELGGKGGDAGGWKGGVVWLVPTDNAIEKWTPIASRVL